MGELSLSNFCKAILNSWNYQDRHTSRAETQNTRFSNTLEKCITELSLGRLSGAPREKRREMNSVQAMSYRLQFYLN